MLGKFTEVKIIGRVGIPVFGKKIYIYIYGNTNLRENNIGTCFKSWFGYEWPQHLMGRNKTRKVHIQLDARYGKAAPYVFLHSKLEELHTFIE